jgi:site-specific recombinase XerC
VTECPARLGTLQAHYSQSLKAGVAARRPVGGTRRIIGSHANSEVKGSPDQEFDANEIVSILLEQLAGKDRLMMTLLYLGGLRLSEGARATGMSNFAIG